MAPKSLRIAYWTATVVFASLLVRNGLLAIMAVPYTLRLRVRHVGIVT
jgi:hypothetical protein